MLSPWGARWRARGRASLCEGCSRPCLVLWHCASKQEDELGHVVCVPRPPGSGVAATRWFRKGLHGKLEEVSYRLLMWLRHSGQHSYKCSVFFDGFAFSGDFLDFTFSGEGCVESSFGHGGGSVGVEFVLCIGIEVSGPEINITGIGWQEERLRAPEA